MCEFHDLPVVLQDLCIAFAWKTTYKNVKVNIDELLLIKSFKLPTMFYKVFMFSSECCRHIYTPLQIYRPFWCYIEMFDICRLKELLYILDFRKRIVKRAGSRFYWMEAFDDHYLNILQFGMYYKLLLASNQNIWTPTYNRQLQNGAATHLH